MLLFPKTLPMERIVLLFEFSALIYTVLALDLIYSIYYILKRRFIWAAVSLIAFKGRNLRLFWRK